MSPLTLQRGIPMKNSDSSKPPRPPLTVSPPTHTVNVDRVHGRESQKLVAEAIKGEYSYGKLGLILGLASIVGGIILGLNGVAGSTSWTAKLLGLESKINDAAPGVVLFVVGLFMVWVTKPRVKMKDLRDR